MSALARAHLCGQHTLVRLFVPFTPAFYPSDVYSRVYSTSNIADRVMPVVNGAGKRFQIFEIELFDLVPTSFPSRHLFAPVYYTAVE